jgi:hypothetical protein
MNQEKRFWQRSWEWLKELIWAIPETVEAPIRDDPKAKNFPLFVRLQREAADSDSGVRQLKLEDVKGEEIIRLMVALMFGLQRGPKGFDDWVLESLTNRSSLQVLRRVFYLYVYDNVGDDQAPVKEEIEERFCQYLIGLHQRDDAPASLRKFIKDLFEEEGGWDNPDYQFESTRQHLSKFLKGFLELQLAICFKPFPPAGEGIAFLAARTPLHHRRAIAKRERELEKLHAQSADSDEPQVNIAVTITAEAGEKNVSLNAHFFRAGARRPQPQGELYLGDWRDRWRLSIGAAEHDEIVCEELKKDVYLLNIDNLKFEKAWKFNLRLKPQPPTWLKMECKPHPTRDASLLDALGRLPGEPEVKLIARALPKEDETLRSELEGLPGFRESIRGLSLVSAIEVKVNEVWLARTKDGTIYKIGRNNDTENREKLDHGKGFDLTLTENVKVHCIWKSEIGELVPQQFCGLLMIEPTPEDVARFTRRPGYAPGTSFSIAYGVRDIFSSGINQDRTLGRNGNVELISVKPDDGRPAYVLKPVDGATNPVFALQQSVRAVESPDTWLVFDPLRGGNLQPDEGTRQAVYNGKVVKVVGANNRLICGTSVFEIKTSFTPNLAMLIAARDAEQGAPSTATPSARRDLDESAILVKLHTTKWRDYVPEFFANTEVADHYILKNKQTDDKRFLKVYRAISVSNAKREARFYAEFRQNADQLYITPPDATPLQDANEEVPWALIFPLLATPTVFSVAQTAAVGYGMAVLLKAMAEKNRVNYDLDESMICLRNDGRLNIVDFDNVFPLSGGALSDSDNELLDELIGARRLPTKFDLLPPEGREFNQATQDVERDLALEKITDRFSTYLLAVALLRLQKLDEKDAAGNATFSKPKLIELAQAQSASVTAAEELAALLGEMLSPQAAARPQTEQVALRMGLIALQFANYNKTARNEIMELLDNRLLPDLKARHSELEKLRDERSLTEQETKDLERLTEHFSRDKDSVYELTINQSEDKE